MPVRIYDIAKRLGIESKEVIAKARDLGISGAKVPSSSLDKITAEYLFEQLNLLRQPTPEAAPASEAPTAPATPPAAEATVAAETPAPLPPVQAVEPKPEPAPASETPPVERQPESAAPTPVQEPPPLPVAEIALSTPPAPAPKVEEPPKAPPVESVPAVAPAEPSPAPLPEIAAAPVAAAPVEPPAPPPPPPPPAAPKIGDKIGFIQLPTRPSSRPAETRPAPARPPVRGQVRPGLPQRPEPRDGRGMPYGRTSMVPPSRAETPKAAPPTAAEPKFVPPATGELITLKPPIVVRDLAERLGRKPFQLIADLIDMNVFANVNQAIDEQISQRLCAKYGFRFEVEKRERGAGLVHAPPKKVEIVDVEDQAADLKPRAPVVTIMGHVDHGKTTLLDVIRKTNVAAGEAGGITQHIGAYTITIPHPEHPERMQQITFLDTPGHAAFSSMRARGANVTDIVILVVAANDGVMPQTLEALSHARAAKVPIIVAVNKCDHPNANPQKARQQLQDKGLVCEEWGGDTIFVDVSALTKTGVDKLLEMIVLQAEVLELKANPTRLAKGNVVESGLEQGGPMATVLVRKGTLKAGDSVICGSFWGRVRALINEDGKRLKEAGPSMAVKVLGLNGVPEAGLEFSVVENEKAARALAEQRMLESRQRDTEARPKVTLENILETIASDSSVKELKVVVKGDTQGSVEAIVDALKKVESDKVGLEVIHSAVGTVTESDVRLASASKAIVLGFHTRIDNGVSELAKSEGVEIRLYSIIYELIDQVKDAMAGLLEPITREVVVGSAEVRKVFALSKGGNVAGCVILNGRVVRGRLRIQRRRNLIFEGASQSIRRFQDEVSEVRAGMECGIRLDGFNDFQVGDIIESFTIEKVAQKL